VCLGCSMVDRSRLADVLIEFVGDMRQEAPIQGILDRLVSRVPQVVPVTGAGVLLIGKDLELRFASASDEVLRQIESLQIEVGEGPCIAAFRSGRQVLIPDLGSDRRFPRFCRRARAAGLGAVFTFPMIVEGMPIGALDVYQDIPGPLDPDDLTACQVLTDISAAYVGNSRAHQTARDRAAVMQQLIMHDPLTGLPNRALLQDRLAVAVAKGCRAGALLAVLFVDLDHFKSVNDRYGHRVGDDLLAMVALRLRQAVRPGDTLARLGGDEFVIVCEDLTDAAAAEDVARRIAETLAQPFPLPAVGELALGASVGIAFAGDTISLPEVILRDADTAMYQAKAAGGGRYVILDAAVHAQPGAASQRERTGARTPAQVTAGPG